MKSCKTIYSILFIKESNFYIPTCNELSVINTDNRQTSLEVIIKNWKRSAFWMEDDKIKIAEGWFNDKGQKFGKQIELFEMIVSIIQIFFQQNSQEEYKRKKNSQQLIFRGGVDSKSGIIDGRWIELYGNILVKTLIFFLLRAINIYIYFYFFTWRYRIGINQQLFDIQIKKYQQQSLKLYSDVFIRTEFSKLFLIVMLMIQKNSVINVVNYETQQSKKLYFLNRSSTYQSNFQKQPNSN
ncbi:unnamed protein product [Paramecium sonneborni]|uniref:Transmembrane protein n=1 Tax=Paramecium sonneborni TaxID=65129 RepID=A0A8S1RUU9_9CILI|nr:unnamed protein product [Paramecium sonneborni]